ncbi:helical backbone metal receptor [Deinococcus fonticola]|uniref:helical backbone metal receptor n=1 Tax=Deinococcus fonticola TaxID=2528713 RepID=UPI001074D1A1|nr:helical backbone metal receptor [Deinococcus fonticola]
MPPLRLASLVSSNSDILAALGVTSWVVAADHHSDAPGLEQARRVGPDLNIDIPALVATKPDLVLASLSVPGLEQVVDGVQKAGLPLLVLDPISVADAQEDVRRIGRALGLDARAEQVVQGWQAEMQRLRRAYPRPPRVVVEWWPRPVINATQDSWVTDLLADLGAENAFADRPGRSAPMHWPEVVDARPDLIVCSWCGAKKLRPEVIAARGLPVPVIPVLESGLGRPGPRLVEGARQIAAALEHLVLTEEALTEGVSRVQEPTL